MGNCMTTDLPEEIKDLENKVHYLNQFKSVAKILTEQIETLESSIKHIQFTNSADAVILPFIKQSINRSFVSVLSTYP